MHCAYYNTKNDDFHRFRVDCRGLNTVTKKDEYPIPNMVAIIDKLDSAKYFSTLDLTKGCFQIPMKNRC